MVDLAFHQRLSSPTLSLRSISTMSEGEALEALRHIRWRATNGDPVCPHCRRTDVYWYKARSIFKCRECRHQFSVTSGTIFASRKMPLKDIMFCVAVFAGGAKGVSALQVQRYTGRNYKTVFVLAHKIREAIQRSDLVLSGAVEIDGCTIGGYRLCENTVKDGFVKRRYKKKFDNRRVVTVAREKFLGEPTNKTKAFVGRKESDSYGFMIETIQSGSVIHADGGRAWDGLNHLYQMLRVHHDSAYREPNGACTNNAESFFSLLRKMQYGVHHHIGAQYLTNYANELAWRQDHRALSEHERITLILEACFLAPVSRAFSNYWQRRRA